MCLTTATIQKLKSKEFDRLFDASKEKYGVMARAGVRFLRELRSPAKDKVMIGDVSEVLISAIKVDAGFVKHLIDNKLTADDWLTAFSDFILEQVYPQDEL
jgi:hypothetical protein